MTSTRLPNKISLKIPMNGEYTVLDHAISRLKTIKLVNTIILATSVESSDEALRDVAKKHEIGFFRGDLNNVLSRFYYAAKEYKLDIVIRMTGDCPFLDPELVQEAIQTHLEMKNDYTTNALERTFPHGLDFEIFNFALLQEAFEHATTDWEREHVTPYIYRTHPEHFKIFHYKTDNLLSDPKFRITLDTFEDYITLNALYDLTFGRTRTQFFGFVEIISTLEKHPWIKLFNQRIIQKKFDLTPEEELEEAKKLVKLQGLEKIYEILLTKGKNLLKYP